MGRTRISLARAVVVGAVLALDAVAATAQVRAEDDENASRWQLGVGAVFATPVGDFSQHVDASPGFSLQLDRRIARGPFTLGGEFAYIRYGGAHRTVSLSELVPEIPGARLKVTTNNEIYLVHARARAQRQAGQWRPYVDGLVGLTALVTQSSIPGVANCNLNQGGTTVCVDSNAASATNAAHSVASYGGGAGIQFRYWSRPIWLDLSMRYLRGGRSRYLTEGDLRAGDGQVVLTFRESRTDMATLYVGVALGR